MSQSVHLICYGPSDSKCVPCSGISGRVAPVYPSSSSLACRFKSQVRIGSPKGAYTRASFICRSSSSGRNRNPDFPRQNRQGFSRSRNRRNEDRDGFENLEESDMLSSKNGPLLSFPNNTKFGATAAPGPREKEIVELFRKVQAQLRERSVVKEEKKVEAVQGQGKDNETVDSLLKLLRKHSVEQAKRNSNSGGNRDFMLDQPGKGGRFSEMKNEASVDSSNSLKDEAEEPIDLINGLKNAAEESTASLSRPPSNFRRKSPINRLTYQPIYSEDDDTVNLVHHVNSSETRKKNHAERISKPALQPEAEAEAELETDLVSEVDHEPEHDTEFVFEPAPGPEQEIIPLLENEASGPEEIVDDDGEVDEEEKEQVMDLSACKLPELRALAKSRGVKGFSKMKKAELLELLSGSSD